MLRAELRIWTSREPPRCEYQEAKFNERKKRSDDRRGNKAWLVGNKLMFNEFMLKFTVGLNT